MITGRVTNLEAIIAIDVAGPTQPPREVEAVIDTGYNGYITLPSDVVSALGLQFAGHRGATLADGSVTILSAYLATVVWHGRKQDVLVSQTAGTPLVGMSMLRGSRVAMDVTGGGALTIDELPKQA